ncbi:sensor histidine kinase [Luteipulveratus flavus]|uniref:histidine kinase n=1 Tax=Luteipulveratus flavus TaxID=3031728 RepID=A0ABT6C1T4_9MICO|nr:HAMP domain-containing sensor histidine kinase [Luteipulveratus sp. YIM 133296]MDF8262715.1 ATP-binding protein [Luteipulveratus sp. YIM 133296]
MSSPTPSAGTGASPAGPSARPHEPARPLDPGPGPAARTRERLAEPLHEMPLRLRLVAVMVSLLAAALAITGAAGAHQLRAYLEDRQANELAQSYRPIANAAHQAVIENRNTTINAVVPENTYVTRIILPATDDRPLPQIRDLPVTPVTGEGSSATTSDGPRPHFPDLSAASTRVEDHRPFIAASEGGGSTRWMVIAGTASDGSVYAVAVSLDRVDEIVSKVRWFSVIVAALALATLAVLGWFAIRRAFRPLRQIEDTAKAIAAGDLSRRVPLAATNDEVSSLSQSINVMLAQIEESFAVRAASEEQMRQFVADASHELRTPLATVRGYAELFRQGAVSDPEDLRSAMRRIEDEAARMGVLVEDLLTLTRLERRGTAPGDQPRSIGPVDLTVIGADAAQDAQALDHGRAIHVVGLNGPMQPVVVQGDEDALRQVVTNLMANAIRYTPEQSPIEIAVGSRDGRAELQVRDHGDGVPPHLRERIFERFYRADASRNSASGGSGLGLAIVAAIVEGHDGTVHVEETVGGGATFVVRVPQVTHSDQPGPVQTEPLE